MFSQERGDDTVIHCQTLNCLKCLKGLENDRYSQSGFKAVTVDPNGFP